MRKIYFTLSAVLLILVYSGSSGDPQVHEWRGPDRSGVYQETGLMKQWPEEGPEETWYVEGIGNGFGSPVIAGDRLYITGEIDSIAVLHCMDLKGNLIWRSTLGKEWVTSYRGSRSSPTLTGEMVYVGTGMGDLYCVDTENGNVLWDKVLQDDFGGGSGPFTVIQKPRWFPAGWSTGPPVVKITMWWPWTGLPGN